LASYDRRSGRRSQQIGSKPAHDASRAFAQQQQDDDSHPGVVDLKHWFQRDVRFGHSRRYGSGLISDFPNFT
jgi:hypothetical protein